MLPIAIQMGLNTKRKAIEKNTQQSKTPLMKTDGYLTHQWNDQHISVIFLWKEVQSTPAIYTTKTP